MKSVKSWVRWCILMTFCLGFAYFEHWTWLSLIPLFVMGFIGLARAAMGLIMGALSKQLATMSPEKRAKVLAGMSNEKRQKLLAEYGIIAFDGAGISLIPGPDWQRIESSPGLPICPPTLIGPPGMVRAMLFAPQISDLQAAVASLKANPESASKILPGSVQQKEFTTSSKLVGLCLSYTERTEKDGSIVDLRSYSYVVKNNQGRCVAISYLATVQKDSDLVHQMILKSLRLE